jgi:hypothetical protein
MKNIFVILFSIILSSASVTQAQVVINPCAQATDIHVVVIGSSTAAGTGPVNPANAWVNRYRDYLQTINPNNLVTNLAVGGTTTYHIMPDWFVPSIAGRPAVTPAKNVSQAISLGADAIILNMPSNDVSNGFGTNEQMFNFQLISSVADSAGIPVWVCTTQPKTSLSTAQKAIQIAVRDSVLSYFGSKALDFWTGFADASNGLATFYDSGDGTHMNDTAHAELNQRVINKGIPNLITDTLSYTDHVVNDIYLSNTSICGESNSMLHVVVTNLGVSSSVTEDLIARFVDNGTSNAGVVGQTAISQLGSCQSDTLNYIINSSNGLDQSYNAYLNMSSDNDISNDTSKTISLTTKGHPTIGGLNDTVFSGANALLTASTGVSDTIVWYDAMTGGNILGYGNSYGINNVVANETVYPEAVRGPLHFAKSLFTTATTSTNWNGIMFNIVALSDIVIDSLQIKVNSTGTQGVVGHYRLGSIVGNEMNASAWTPWGTDTVNAVNAGEFKTVDFTDISLQANDTLGVYVHMQNQGATLSYQNSAAATYANAEIQVQDGTGSGYTFGTTYSPRNWSGEVFYHYGFNPQGDCQSERLPVSAIIKFPSLLNNLNENQLSLSPNPSTGLFSLQGDILPAEIQVLNVAGQVVFKENLRTNTFDLSHLNRGVYILTYQIKGARYNHKLVLN